MTRFRVFCLVFIFSICSAAFLSAADDTLTITTYYPSPYGVYKTLRLYPSTDATSGSSCTNKEGEMSYNSNDHVLYVCSGASPTWQSAGGGHWAANGNNIYNTNTDNVGIGTSSPQGKLDVRGDKVFFKKTAAGDQIRFMPGDAAAGSDITGVNNNETNYARLDIDGSSIIMQTSSGGNVGIGTVGPRSRLEVSGGDITVGGVYKVGTTSGETDCVTTGYSQCSGGVLTIRYACFIGGIYYGWYDASTGVGCGAGSGY